ncbi:hypothetical protein PQX77_013529 [Marasmius sp. AFHP31]|nr:hypothetical protein PQX77_013529 [Marasmius sp. AFHP31]
MPRKRTESAIIKASRTEEEKQLARQRSRAAANRRYRHKMTDDHRLKARERMRERRKNMSEEDKVQATNRQSQYNYNYYSLNRDVILYKAHEKRTQAFVSKHGMAQFHASYPQRIHKRKSRDAQQDPDNRAGDPSEHDLPYSSSDEDFL